jgi:hypothetical protein
MAPFLRSKKIRADISRHSIITYALDSLKTEFIFYKLYINNICMQVCSDCNKNENIILNAVKNGHIYFCFTKKCLKYAHLNGCTDFFAKQKRHPLRSNIDTTSIAVEYNQLECIKYIYRNTEYSSPECEELIKPIINDWIKLVNIAKEQRSNLYEMRDIWNLIGKYW